MDRDCCASERGVRWQQEGTTLPSVPHTSAISPHRPFPHTFAPHRYEKELRRLKAELQRRSRDLVDKRALLEV